MESDQTKTGSVFFKEVYWFIVICLVGSILAILVIPPRASKYWKMLELESRLASRNAELEEQARVLDARAESMDTDPFYREAEIRKILGVKKNSEEYLEFKGDSIR